MAENSSEKSIITDEEIISDESSSSSDYENLSPIDDAVMNPGDYADYFNKQNHDLFFAKRKRLPNVDSSIKRGTHLKGRIRNSLASNYTAFDSLYPFSDRPSSLSSNYTPLHPLHSDNNRPSSLASNNITFDPFYPHSEHPSSFSSNYTPLQTLYPYPHSNRLTSLAYNHTTLYSFSNTTSGMPRSDASSNMNTVPSQESNIFPALKKVYLTNSTLHPPNPNAPRPTTRDKPLGCKTVFVCGLPEKATEEIIKEIFEKCGTILTIRMSKKNFCHVRFSNEAAVENAIGFSGYRLMIENKDEPTYYGRLHVDYAQTKDDLDDYKNSQQDLEHQAHHKEQNNCRPVTPPVVLYTDQEVSFICDKLKNEDTFSEAASILISWCEEGNCTKETADTFFSLIQSIHDHAKNLQVSKVKYEEQLNETKNKLKRIVLQFTEIERVCKAPSLQKCLDHFTEDQKNNIEVLKRQSEELKYAFVDKVINECEVRELELHDDENDITNELNMEQLKQGIHRLREEGDTLKCQLEAAQNEILAVQSDYIEKLKQKDDILKKSRLDNNQMLSKIRAELSELKAKYGIESGENGKKIKALKMKLKQKDDESAAVQKVLQDLNDELLNMRLKCIKYEAELKELHTLKRRRESDLQFL